MKSSRRSSVTPSATVSISDGAARLKARGVDVIDLAAGRASEHSPEFVVAAAIRALRAHDVHQTMAQGHLEFREAAACKLARENGIVADPETEILASSGAKNGLMLSVLSLLDPGDAVLIEDPGFVSYEPTLRYLGVEARPVPLRAERGYRWSREDLEARDTAQVRAILLCSPQNPTGVVHTAADLRTIADFAIERDLWVICDLPYERTTLDGRAHICIGTLPGMAERSVHLFSMTKSHAMGGWRCGFVHAPAPQVAQMTVAQGHLSTCVSSFVQSGAAVALREGPDCETRENWKVWAERVASVSRRLAEIEGLRCELAEGGFYAWVDIRELGVSSTDFAERLCDDAHVTVVPGCAFGPSGEGFIRVTCVKAWDLLDEALDRIRTFVTAMREER